MAIVRQLPALYLRGSIATVTMAGLNESERRHVDNRYQYVVTHPALNGHKQKVIQELGFTIRGDYAEDRTSAEQEFNIAVWRGVVHLYYHKKYKFKCANCGATSSFTKRGKPKPIDRAELPCPECRMAEVVNPGCSTFSPGQFVNHDDSQNLFKDTPYNTPTFRSCIKPSSIGDRYDNPDSILDCPTQLKKFFGEFIWNYFRQQIRENKRREKNKEPIEISGRADEMVLEQILSLCSKMKVDYNKHHKTKQSYKKYTIEVNGLSTPPEFSAELVEILANAENHNVKIIIDNNCIEVIIDRDLPNITVLVAKPEHITVIDNSTNCDDDDHFSIEQISKGDSGMDSDDHVLTVDMRDAASRTRAELPEETQQVYDILSQVGDTYDRFAEQHGAGSPRINHIAEFLGITPRAVKSHKDTIALHCLKNQFVLH